MKRLLSILLSAAFTLTLMAQGQMSVKSFTLMENDHDARAHQRKDANDHPAALIKVQTTETNLFFSAGRCGPVGNVEYKPGEVWVYVTRDAQKLTIGHNRYGVLRDYMFPIPIRGGSVYQLVLDLGVGRYMNISATANAPGAVIIVGNDTLGPSPVVQCYIPFGQHHVKVVSTKDYMEGDTVIDVTRTSPEDLLVQMHSVRDLYHEVTLRAGAGIQILLDKQLKGSDTWKGRLREGEHVITTHRDNYDDVNTLITVGKTGPYTFDLQKPLPVNGTLKLNVTPLHASVTRSQGLPVSHREALTLPAGRHYFSFKAPGYYSQEDVAFDVLPHQTITHTVKLLPIDYVKSTSFYAGAGFTYASLSGVSATAGLTLFNVDLQLTYTMGLQATDKLSWYAEADNSFYSRMTYKMHMFGARLGYQIHLSNRLAITPQVGYVSQFLSGTTVEGSGKLGDGASAASFTAGAKLIFIPAHHVGLFLMPEYGIKVSETEAFTAIADKGGPATGGLMATAGIFFNF